MRVLVEKACMTTPPQRTTEDILIVGLRSYRWLIQGMNGVAHIAPREYIGLRRPSQFRYKILGGFCSWSPGPGPSVAVSCRGVHQQGLAQCG